MDLLPEIAHYIDREELLRPGEGVLVAVSGGADSLTLLDCLQRLEYRCVVAHFDHQLRPESKQEAGFVAHLARSHNLQSVMGEGDVRALAQEGHSIEEAARLLRYRFLVQAARQHGLGTIAVGHSGDDQAETILMHLLRGAGPLGLQGMLPLTRLDRWSELPGSEGLVLVRPLLGVSRAQISAHCYAMRLEPRHDSSNLEVEFTRNWLRHDLLPQLEVRYPGVRAAMGRTGQLMREVNALLSELTSSAWQSTVEERGESMLVVRTEAFKQQPAVIQRMLVREAIGRLSSGSREISFEATERAISFVKGCDQGGSQSVPGGMVLLHRGVEVLLCEHGNTAIDPQWPQMNGDNQIPLLVPGSARLNASWILRARSVRAGQVDWKRIDERQAVVLDSRALGASLMVRTPMPGDRLSPMGMEGSTKVARLLMNARVPQEARPRWPLLVAGEQILWVVGLRRGCQAALEADSEQAVLVSLEGSPESPA